MTPEHPTPIPPSGIGELAREWDSIADERHRQISSHDDVSFHHVLLPLTLELLAPSDSSALLDAGCGTGDLTAHLVSANRSITAVDPSAENLRIARQVLGQSSDVTFLHGALEQRRNELKRESFTAGVLAMTLMTVPDLTGFVSALGHLMARGSHVVATMAHPWFWPRYWGYSDEEWFEYQEEIFIKAPFNISLVTSAYRTTHVHRPLEAYMAAFAAEGFVLEALREPMPDAETSRRYPTAWEYPRFLGLRWRKGV